MTKEDFQDPTDCSSVGRTSGSREESIGSLNAFDFTKNVFLKAPTGAIKVSTWMGERLGIHNVVDLLSS